MNVLKRKKIMNELWIEGERSHSGKIKKIMILNEDRCLEMIRTNHNTYFKCREIAEEIIAEQYEVKLKYVLDCLKRLDDPYKEDRIFVRARLLHVLKRLKEKGLIEKYNARFWRIIRK